MVIRLATIWCVMAGTAIASDAPSLRRFETTGVEMAVPIRLVLYAPDAESANRATDAALAEFRRLNAIFSDYDAASESRRLCDRDNPQTPMAVSEDLFTVLTVAERISSHSGGAFDVTVGPFSRLWRRALRRAVMPPPKRLVDARGRVGYRLVKLDSRDKSVALRKPGMRLDFGGIAKGYALDAALAVLRRHGIDRALVDASGDIRLGDPPPGRPGWRIGIARLDDSSPPRHFVEMSNAAVATSGDAWQYVEIDGRRYSHIVDPRTGIALTDHSSVTVIASDAMTADALASAVSVLGPDEGIKLVERFPGVATLIVRASPEGPKVFLSARMKAYLLPDEPSQAASPK